MPTTTPLIKVNRTKSYGAEVVLYGDVYDEACQKAYELADKEGYTFIHPFDDLAVATGQERSPWRSLRSSAGGVHSGSDRRGRTGNRCVHTGEASESEDQSHRRGAGGSELYAGFLRGRKKSNDAAAGQHHCGRHSGQDTGKQDFPYIQKNLDDIITVEDDELVVAFLDMVENHKMIVENSGLLTVKPC